MPGLDDIRLKLEQVAARFDAKGMELLEITVRGHQNDVLIEVTADKPSGGITIQECAIMNKSLVAAIEEEQFLPPEHFSLELSSPGLDRPLVTRRDFLRVVGQDIHFWLNEAIGGKKEAEGVLLDVGELALTIDVNGKKQLALPLNAIIKGILVL